MLIHNKEKPDDDTFASLEIIASQCPLSAGKGVYLARDLIGKFDYDDKELCGIVDSRGEYKLLDQEISGDLHAYPNPTSSITNINLPAAGTLQLYDMNGVQIFQQSQKESGYLELNLGHLPSGFYTLLLISEAGFFQSKLIKQ